MVSVSISIHRAALAALAAFGLAACDAADNRVDPGDLALRDLLGFEPEVAEAGAAIQERILQGVLSGELMPGQLKPSTGVAFAGDVLDAVEAANGRFTAALRADQRDALAGHPFDVADYLLFAVRWEDMLGVAE